jgi:hypothetical protein
VVMNMHVALQLIALTEGRCNYRATFFPGEMRKH